MQTYPMRAQAFIRDEDGAITVEWVVITGATIGLALGAVTAISGGVTGITGNTADGMAAVIPDTAPEQPQTPAFARNQWEARTGGVAGLEAWMANFADQQLLDHMNNQAEFATTQQAGHPYDTYHDEYWVARDEAITRGLIEPEDAT